MLPSGQSDQPTLATNQREPPTNASYQPMLATNQR